MFIPWFLGCWNVVMGLPTISVAVLDACKVICMLGVVLVVEIV